MNIFNINNSTPNTSFQAYYKSLKNVKGVNCGCCGKKMIEAIDIRKAYATTAKPLSKMIEKGFMTKWIEKLPIWNTLIQLSQQHPELSLDKILLNEKNYKKMKNAILRVINPENKLNQKEFGDKYLQEQQELLKNSRNEMRSAKTIMSRFKVFREALKEDEKEVFDLLEYYADLHPRETLKEIISREEILNFHKGVHNRQKGKTEKLRALHFNRIDKMIAKKNPNAAEHFKNVREKATEILLHDFDLDANFCNVKKLYQEELKTHGLEKITHKVIDELKDMPLKNHSADSFFGYAYHNNLNDGEIIYFLLKPSIKTFDHIEAVFNNGKDSLENGILLCHQCNHIKSSIPCAEFVEYHPQMPYHTQKQILQISDLILSGKANSNLKFWPIRVANTFEKSSEGKIKPDISSYCKKSEKKMQKEQKLRNEQEQIRENERKEILKKQNELKKEMLKLEQEDAKKKDELNNLKSQEQDDKRLLNEMKQYLKNKKK